MTPMKKKRSRKSDPLTVFLCHASADKNAVELLYERLSANRIKPWLDKKDLLPGKEWEAEIQKALRAADVVLVCLSNHAVTKTGFVQKEIRYALDIADQQPEGAIFLIPVKMEECEVPDRLRRWQWVALYERGGFSKLLSSLKARARVLGRSLRAVPADFESHYVPLPYDLKIVPPTTDCPVEYGIYSGKWFGVWDAILDHVLVVEEITPPTVIAIYAWGIAEQWRIFKPGWTRVRGNIESGSLVLRLPRPATVTYRFRRDGSLDATYEYKDGIARATMKAVESRNGEK